MDPSALVASLGALLVGITVIYLLKRLLVPKKRPGSVRRDYEGRRWRRLGSMESVYARFHSLGIRSSELHAVLRLRGPLAPADLRSALAAIAHSQPLLQVGIHADGQDYYFHTFPDYESKIRLEVVERRDEGTAEATVEALANDFPPLLEHLLPWKVTLVHGGSAADARHEVIWSCLHTNCDGLSFVHFARDLLRALHQIRQHLPPSLPKQDFPPSAFQTILAQHGPKLSALQRWAPRLVAFFVSELLHSPPKLPIDRPAPGPERINRHIFQMIPREVQERFYLACKAHNVTFTSGFAACVMNACQEVKDLKGSDRVTFYIPCNLRQLVEPKLSNEVYGCAIIAHELVAPARPSQASPARVWAWAQANQKELHSDLIGIYAPAVERMNAVEEAFRVGWLGGVCERILKADPSSRGAFSVSNFGSFNMPELDGLVGLSLEGLYIAGSTNYNGPCPLFLLLSLNSSLYLSFNYPEPLVSGDTAREFLSRLRRTLDQVSGAPQ